MNVWRTVPQEKKSLLFLFLLLLLFFFLIQKNYNLENTSASGFENSQLCSHVQQLRAGDLYQRLLGEEPGLNPAFQQISLG